MITRKSRKAWGQMSEDEQKQEAKFWTRDNVKEAFSKRSDTNDQLGSTLLKPLLNEVKMDIEQNCFALLQRSLSPSFSFDQLWQWCERCILHRSLPKSKFKAVQQRIKTYFMFDQGTSDCAIDSRSFQMVLWNILDDTNTISLENATLAILGDDYQTTGEQDDDGGYWIPFYKYLLWIEDDCPPPNNRIESLPVPQAKIATKSRTEMAEEKRRKKSMKKRMKKEKKKRKKEKERMREKKASSSSSDDIKVSPELETEDDEDLEALRLGAISPFRPLNEDEDERDPRPPPKPKQKKAGGLFSFGRCCGV